MVNRVIRTPLMVAVVALWVLAALLGGTAGAAHSGGEGEGPTYSACRRIGGDIIKIHLDSEEDRPCKPWQTVITWNAQGPAGADGIQGIQGIPGVDGADGAPGVDGADGAPGVDGVDGAPGPPGADGADGATGPGSVERTIWIPMESIDLGNSFYAAPTRVQLGVNSAFEFPDGVDSSINTIVPLPSDWDGDRATLSMRVVWSSPATVGDVFFRPGAQGYGLGDNPGAGTFNISSPSPLPTANATANGLNQFTMSLGTFAIDPGDFATHLHMARRASLAGDTLVGVVHVYGWSLSYNAATS